MNSPRRHRFRRPLAAAIVASAALLWLLPSPQRPQPSREAYPVRGIDISAHNGNVDFKLVAEEGIEFVIMKATEGATFKDSRFGANHRAARDAGLKVGAYHFFRFDVDGSLQAMNLINSVNGRRLDLPVMIDIEEWTNPDDVSTPEILKRISGMVDHLQRSGYDVALYTNKDGHRRFIDNSFSDLPLWICSFTDPPSKKQWHLWQYNHRGHIDGIDGPVDLNVFNGHRDEWELWLASVQQPR